MWCSMFCVNFWRCNNTNLLDRNLSQFMEFSFYVSQCAWAWACACIWIAYYSHIIVTNLPRTTPNHKWIFLSIFKYMSMIYSIIMNNMNTKICNWIINLLPHFRYFSFILLSLTHTYTHTLRFRINIDRKTDVC